MQLSDLGRIKPTNDGDRGDHGQQIERQTSEQPLAPENLDAGLFLDDAAGHHAGGAGEDHDTDERADRRDHH